MKIRHVFAVLAVSFGLGARDANAEWCTKNFPYHFVTSDGQLGLYQGQGGGWWYACSISTTLNGVTPESCKAALASYLLAKVQGKPITLSYPGTCAALDGADSNSVGFYWFGVYW